MTIRLPAEWEPHVCCWMAWAVTVIAGDGRYDAITSVLKREPPRIQGRRSGDPIIPAAGDLVPPAARAISQLDRSHMLVQGPPGAGKTFLSAYAIVELMAQGRRVGVASNSHTLIAYALISPAQRKT